MVTFYILYSSSLDKFYIGHTGLPMQDRLRRHLSNHSGYTGRAKDWEVVFTEDYANKAEAMTREYEVKGWKSALQVKALINKSS
jgi:putative endonuclease